MHLIYIDESKETVGSPFFIYSALSIHEDVWHRVFHDVKTFRQYLKAQYGIFIKKELHAWKFVSGRGQIAKNNIDKKTRVSIFKETLEFITKLDTNHSNVALFNSANTNELYAFERIINRINRTMSTWNSKAILLFDEGQEVAFTNRIRRMGVFNYIPSQFGTWLDTGTRGRNLVIDRIIEDPVFKKSEQSNFIQLVISVLTPFYDMNDSCLLKMPWVYMKRFRDCLLPASVVRALEIRWA